MMIKQPALAPPPQPRPAPTVRALPAELAVQRGPFWMPIRGPNPTPIDTERGGLLRSSDEAAVMVVERRGRAIDHESGQLATGGARSSTEGGSLQSMARA